MKKAQGISVNVIIIAAIALLVLVVLSVIFIGRMGGWGKETNSCVANGGKCAQACGEVMFGTEDHKTEYSIWDCPGEANDVCCIKAGP